MNSGLSSEALKIFCLSGKFACNAEWITMPWATAPSMLHHPDNDCVFSNTVALCVVTNSLFETTLGWFRTLAVEVFSCCYFLFKNASYSWNVFCYLIFSFELPNTNFNCISYIQLGINIIRNWGQEAERVKHNHIQDKFLFIWNHGFPVVLMFY